MNKGKSYEIPKQLVWEAWKQVKANKGAEGVDEQTIEEFEENLKDNLYKLWNRMSSGSYMPKPVRKVLIPKSDGGKRELGIPTVSDRIAQMVAKLILEPKVDSYFHQDSYGYRPNKSAIEAVGMARKRCWKHDWVLDIDIKSFFSSISHELLMRAVKKHTDCKWMLLYIERWLKAPIQQEDGTLVVPETGTPQGGVASPLLSNLYLHYAFDVWMGTYFPDVPFERFADDIVAHCKTEDQAQKLRESLEKRFSECKLSLHPEKTKIVYCKDDDRSEKHSFTSFDFLGYTFRSRRSKNRWGKCFINFSPAVSNKAKLRMRKEMRHWRLQHRMTESLGEIAQAINPVVRGWLNYFQHYYKSSLYPLLHFLDMELARWSARKYKRFHRSIRQAYQWLRELAQREPTLFAHWNFGAK